MSNFKLSQVHRDLEVISSAGQVVGACPLLTIGVGYPEIGVDVLPTDEVEDLKLQCPLFDMFGGGLAHELRRLGVEDIRGT